MALRADLEREYRELERIRKSPKFEQMTPLDRGKLVGRMDFIKDLFDKDAKSQGIQKQRNKGEAPLITKEDIVTGVKIGMDTANTVKEFYTGLAKGLFGKKSEAQKLAEEEASLNNQIGLADQKKRIADLKKRIAEGQNNDNSIR